MGVKNYVFPMQPSWVQMAILSIQFSRMRRLSRLGAQRKAVSKPSGILVQTRSLDFLWRDSAAIRLRLPFDKLRTALNQRSLVLTQVPLHPRKFSVAVD
jgi:hypothetical protein